MEEKDDFGYVPYYNVSFLDENEMVCSQKVHAYDESHAKEVFHSEHNGQFYILSVSRIG